MRYLDCILACNRHDLSRFRPFYIGGERLGWVRPALMERLLTMPEIFESTPDGITLSPRHDNFTARSAALATAVQHLAAAGQLPDVRGELYPVLTQWGAPPLAQIDRGAVSGFGLCSFGLHVNGWVRKADGIHMWLGRRAADRLVEPDKLDNMVAGGHPIGISLRDNLLKEAAEEASLPAEIAARALSVGAITYTREVPHGLQVDTIFAYDLELPEGLMPVNEDGEVAEFMLLPLAEAAALTREPDRFKFNCGPVVIDFLIRHGFLTPDEPDYLAIVRGLHDV